MQKVCKFKLFRDFIGHSKYKLEKVNQLVKLPSL